MSILAPQFSLGYFIKSILDNLFWVILLASLVGIPILQIVLIYLNLPVINGELVSPFLAFTMLSDPSRAIPLIKSIMASDIFRVAVFPGFGFAALLAAGTIFAERKLLAKLQLRVGPFLLWKNRRNFTINGRWSKTCIKGNHNSCKG